MIIHVSQEARADLLEADQYYSAINVSIGDRLLIEFESLIKHIATFPKSGIPYGKRYKLFLFQEFPYTISCMIKRDRVEIVRIIHNDRHPKYRTKRVK